MRCLILALVLLAGCASSESIGNEPRTSRLVATSRAMYNGDLIAVDDSLRGVTCYSQGTETLSCVKTR